MFKYVYLLTISTSAIVKEKCPTCKYRHEHELTIKLSRKENFGLSIFVEDKNTAAARTILSNYQAYSGSRINIPDMNNTWNKHFIFSFTQYQFSENDPVGLN